MIYVLIYNSQVMVGDGTGPTENRIWKYVNQVIVL